MRVLSLPSGRCNRGCETSRRSCQDGVSPSNASQVYSHTLLKSLFHGQHQEKLFSTVQPQAHHNSVHKTYQKFSTTDRNTNNSIVVSISWNPPEQGHTLHSQHYHAYWRRNSSKRTWKRRSSTFWSLNGLANSVPTHGRGVTRVMPNLLLSDWGGRWLRRRFGRGS